MAVSTMDSAIIGDLMAKACEKSVHLNSVDPDYDVHAMGDVALTSVISGINEEVAIDKVELLEPYYET